MKDKIKEIIVKNSTGKHFCEYGKGIFANAKEVEKIAEEIDKLYSLPVVSKTLISEKEIGKFIIVKPDLTDYMKDKEGNISIYNSFNYTCSVRGVYEFDDALILKIEG